jgi:hypothetical protein
MSDGFGDLGEKAFGKLIEYGLQHGEKGLRLAGLMRPKPDEDLLRRIQDLESKNPRANPMSLT